MVLSGLAFGTLSKGLNFRELLAKISSLGQCHFDCGLLLALADPEWLRSGRSLAYDTG